ncbi:ATP-binding cassette sub-family G member 4-like [Haematobia irritans]|uniref:ATP-binding cassette sub-family G member 4-like n=1 Tax=Haematobia irritans TaxID=7368 RepID=UPI003F50CD18
MVPNHTSSVSLVDLRFKDLTYRVKNGVETKTILNSANGEFRAGELSVIVGASGSGKTTLLNLLAHYRIRTNDGDIIVNGKSRNLHTFRQLSRYVTQDENLIPCFTVLEAMTFASYLQLGSHISKDNRKTIINDMLDIFHLNQTINTLISDISSGERKRLSIALELIGNPAVLLLDEPTTGLDEFTAFQCIRIFKELAKCGHTIICSLHSPSAKLSQMFDKVYVMSRGECIYQGSVNNILPYLEEFNLSCPITHNPLDFIIDVSTNTYGDYQCEMTREIGNGDITEWLPYLSRFEPKLSSNYMHLFDMQDMRVSTSKKSQRSRQCSWWLEYQWLLLRFVQQMWREKANFKLRIMAHIASSIVIGLIFYNVPRNARYSLFNYFLAIAFITGAIFLAMAPMLATVPRDIQFMRREYYNQWYRLSSYFLAMVTAQLIILGPMSIVFAVIIYFITGQPMELDRLLLLVFISMLTSLVSSTFGLLLGTAFKGLYVLFLGPMGIAIMLLFTNLASKGGELPMIYKILMYGSFMRHTLEGVLVPLLGNDHPDFPCPHCEWVFTINKPEYVLKLLGCSDISYVRAVIVLTTMTMMFCLLAFCILKFRLEFKQNSRKK